MLHRLVLSLTLLLFTHQLLAQQFNYDAHWAEVDKYYEKSQPQSALKELDIIYKQALKDDSEVNWLKALLLQIRMQSDIDPEDFAPYLALIDESIPAAKPPARAILYSMKGEVMWRFLTQNLYNIRSRTRIAADTTGGMESWGIDRLHQEINNAYHASLADPQMLQRRDIKRYDAILYGEQNTRQLQPTLYDLLSTRALEYYSSGGVSAYNAGSRFYIRDSAGYAPVATFIKFKFPNPDTLSTLGYEALQLHQQVLAFKVATGSREAILHADLARIDFVHNNDAILRSPYQQALERMLKEYDGLPEHGEVYHRLAEHLYNTATTGDRKAKIEQAIAYCRQAIDRYPGTPGAVSCQRLVVSITNDHLSFNTDRVNIPGKPFLAYVRYRNARNIHFRVIKLTSDLRKQLNAGGSFINLGDWKLLNEQPVATAWTQPVPDPGDYKNHGAEVKIEALPVGQYILHASTNKEFRPDSGAVASHEITVSSLAYFHNSSQLFVVDRESGKPVPEARVSLINAGTPLYTNAQGMVNMPSGKTVFQTIEISKDGDTLKAEGSYMYPVPTRVDRKETKIWFFTDRGIYRPGQTVHFKGIVTEHNIGKVGKDKLKTGYKSRLALIDANGNKVDSIIVTSNDYGSYTGSFRIPTGLLNGVYQVNDDETGRIHSIRVEEYKRPKFSVVFDTIRINYRAGDTLTVKGTATALNGAVIDGAHVEYKVTTPQSDYAIYGREVVSRERLVVKGETTTDSAGHFYVRFPTDTARRDESLSMVSNIVEASVTDRSGETREANHYVFAGNRGVFGNISVTINNRDSISIWPTTKNLSHYTIPAPVTIRATRLQPPAKLKRDRRWSVPDQFVMSEEEFEKYFPRDHYKEAFSEEGWPRAAQVWSQHLDSVDGIIKLNVKNWEDGVYLFEIAGVDARGDSIYQKTTTHLEDVRKKSFAVPTYLWAPQIAKTGKPGRTVTTMVGTSATGANVMQVVTRHGKDSYSWLPLSQEKKHSDFRLTDEDHEGLAIEYLMVKDNRFYRQSRHISVRWENTMLDLQLATFRNKLEPGEKQTWQIQVRDEKKQKAAAEMLAAMYDASLDQLHPHQWQTPEFFNTQSLNYRNWTGDAFRTAQSINSHRAAKAYDVLKSFDDARLNWFGWQYQGIAGGRINNNRYGMPKPTASDSLKAVEIKGYGSQKKVSMTGSESKMMIRGQSGIQLPGDNLDYVYNELIPPNRLPLPGRVPPPPPPGAGPVSAAALIRRNLQETAFFLPQLKTDAKGSITFSFTTPEALTKWRFMAMAHTKDMQTGYTEASVVTQKTLMVQPNAPRFLREGDKIELTAKIISLANKELIGQARLELLNAATMQPVDGWFQNVFPVQHFTVKPQQSTVVSFPLQIPFGYNDALVYRVVAEAGDFSDGEENALPVLSNRILVTETMPLPVQGDNPVTFKMEKLLHSDTIEGLQHHAVTVAFNANPVWDAVKSLPYLMEYPYDCSEQTFNRLYANAIGAHLVNRTPRIKAVFGQWQADTMGMTSKLEINEELKSALLEETPWVLDAKNEVEQRHRLALLFDLSLMEHSMNSIKEKLKFMQTSEGAFSWFKDMPGSYYITQYIVSGFGHLRQLGITGLENDEAIKTMMHDALGYLDRQILERYQQEMKKNIQGYHSMVYHLYMRSFYKDWVIPAASRPAYEHYFKQVKKDWRRYNNYGKGLAALALHREGDSRAAQEILASVKEHALQTPTDGAYWKEPRGYYWYEAPVETQALMIEAFSVVTKDSAFVTALKTWLLKNKQTNSWSTTKATAEACYALLIGNNWMHEDQHVQIKLGEQVIDSRHEKQEAGTGYFSKRFEGKRVTPGMGEVTIQLQNSTGQPAWGGLYWQYFQDMDKITASATPLTIEKELFIQQTDSKGTVLTRITEGNALKVGDKVTVRIIMKVQQEMEYLHLKDLRAACFEPVNVLSGYRWRDGIGYYESTKDASTNFFFSSVRPGTYVFEYPVFVTHTGSYSNGISTLQCMYAPEFSAHSDGEKVRVTE
ncbi:MG2 domain-containing protein [Chitinophaga horti]|uniref:MG2 domain-containing protein n=1 Tax=Chitinophaga horti TaxID=2920382 RepID=A0ABY6IXZ5_9BACT|nr:alpha-2-macroglobulin family protein [Chitinophaga horti]UYQ92256.1 MG2 domain-containing protein [Chitinophaga horti]